MKLRWTVVLLLATITLRGDGCRRDRDEPAQREAIATITEVANFWPLTQGQGFYQLWLGSPATPPPAGMNPWEVEQAYTPVAAFRVDVSGATLDLDGASRVTWPIPDTIDASDIARARITYEPSGSTPPDPLDPLARFVLAAGSFVAPGGTVTADATARDGEVSQLPLDAMTGSFQLISPTTPNPNDEALGLWFVTGDNPLVPALDLGAPSSLAPDRIFEGWVFRRDITGTVQEIHSSGRFRRVDQTDHDVGGPGQGPDPAPLAPGQEFHATLAQALNVTEDWEVMISLEPEPDGAPNLPTGLRLLRGAVGQSAPSRTDLPLVNTALRDELPTATVQVRR